MEKCCEGCYGIDEKGNNLIKVKPSGNFVRLSMSIKAYSWSPDISGFGTCGFPSPKTWSLMVFLYDSGDVGL